MAGVDRDTLMLAGIQARIDKIPRGSLRLSEYLGRLGITSMAQNCSLSIPVFGRTGPLFPDDGELEPRRIEAIIRLPLREDGQKAQIIIQLLMGEQYEMTNDSELVDDLKRALLAHKKDGEVTHDFVVWQSKLLR
jgi:hypothetical protein